MNSESTMQEIVEALTPLRRDLISDGYDQAVALLRAVLPFEVDRYPSGTECWTWIVPEKWICHEARLERLDGEVIFSDREQALHVVSYSLPFEGIVSRETLLQHLHVHPLIPEAVPFIFKYYQRDWGLCCSRNLRESLNDAEYRVVIKTEFPAGELKVARYELPGESDETVVLCAHLCHPGQANDDVSGVAVGVEMMRRLARMTSRRFSYVFLVVPETIGSVAWLSHNAHRIPRLRSGIFLEMLGLNHPHSVQLTYSGTEEIDQLAKLALMEEEEDGWTGPLLRVIGNDERQFNAPGVRVPMISVARVLPYDHEHYPFREYHSDFDNVSLCRPERLEKSVALVERILFLLENNKFPRQTVPGEVFLSRYNLHRDWFSDQRASDLLYKTMFQFDGLSSISEIATKVDGTFEEVLEIARSFAKAGILEMMTTRNDQRAHDPGA